MEPLTIIVELGKYMLLGYVLLLLGRAVAARVAGPHAELVLDAPLINIPITINRAPLPPHSDDDDEESPRETGNRETPETAGNTRETAGETPDLLTLGYAGEQHLAPRMNREEYHELLRVRQEAIGLLERCVKYYRDNQMADSGVIPRYNWIHMKPEDRGRIVDNLWYSQWVIKAPNITSIDPAYFPTCSALMQAIIDKTARVYPMGYLERKKQLLDSAVSALPEAAHEH